MQPSMKLNMQVFIVCDSEFSENWISSGKPIQYKLICV